jgi:hypothetical protein
MAIQQEVQQEVVEIADAAAAVVVHKENSIEDS